MLLKRMVRLLDQLRAFSGIWGVVKLLLLLDSQNEANNSHFRLSKNAVSNETREKIFENSNLLDEITLNIDSKYVLVLSMWPTCGYPKCPRSSPAPALSCFRFKDARNVPFFYIYIPIEGDYVEIWKYVVLKGILHL